MKYKSIEDVQQTYDIIYADPPWSYIWGKGKDGGKFSPEKHYKTMSVEDICAMGTYIRRLRNKNCALFIWATMPCLPDCFKVIEAWGFKYKTCAFTWIKTTKEGRPISGMGSYTKSNAELCLMAMRGHIKSVDKTVPQVIMFPRKGHSVKPDEAMRRIERLFGNTKKIELFARRQKIGWDCMGDQINDFVQEEL